MTAFCHCFSSRRKYISHRLCLTRMGGPLHKSMPLAPDGDILRQTMLDIFAGPQQNMRADRHAVSVASLAWISLLTSRHRLPTSRVYRLSQYRARWRRLVMPGDHDTPTELSATRCRPQRDVRHRQFAHASVPPSTTAHASHLVAVPAAQPRSID